MLQTAYIVYTPVFKMDIAEEWCLLMDICIGNGMLQSCSIGNGCREDFSVAELVKLTEVVQHLQGWMVGIFCL